MGARIYNFFHHEMLAAFLFIVGAMIDNYLLSLIGIILWGHASMDRIFGYGLKYYSGFKDTHLGTFLKKGLDK